jgi:membrane protein DedA with SNARE-associated domain
MNPTKLLANPFIDQIADIIVAFIKHQAIFAPMLLLVLEEAGVPLPLPGDVFIIYSGYQVTRGAITYAVSYTLILAATLLGSSILFLLSKRFGQTVVLKLGNYIHFNKKKLDLLEEKFRKYGVLVIIFGRHIPGFRVPITIFAGMSKISYKQFILSTLVSVVFSITFNLALGEKLGPRAARLLHAHHSLYFVSMLPALALGIWYVYMVIKSRGEKRVK